jgi:hypothetical protein
MEFLAAFSETRRSSLGISPVIVQLPEITRPVLEIAILVTGAHFHFAYEINAHVLVAELRGLATTRLRRLLLVSVRAISRAKKPSLMTWHQFLFQVEFYWS